MRRQKKAEATETVWQTARLILEDASEGGGAERVVYFILFAVQRVDT